MRCQRGLWNNDNDGYTEVIRGGVGVCRMRLDMELIAAAVGTVGLTRTMPRLISAISISVAYRSLEYQYMDSTL